MYPGGSHCNIGSKTACCPLVSDVEWTDYEFIPTVEMESRHAVDEPTVSEFSLIYDLFGVMAAWSRMKIFETGNFRHFKSFFWKNDPLRRNCRNSVPKFFMRTPIDVLCTKFREIWRTRNRWNCAVFTGQKKNKISPSCHAVATKRIPPEIRDACFADAAVWRWLAENFQWFHCTMQLTSLSWRTGWQTHFHTPTSKLWVTVLQLQTVFQLSSPCTRRLTLPLHLRWHWSIRANFWRWCVQQFITGSCCREWRTSSTTIQYHSGNRSRHAICHSWRWCFHIETISAETICTT